MVKKKVSPKKKPARKPARKPAPSLGDRSRIDTKPLQAHIRKRIEELSKGGTARSGSPDDTIARLQVALDTLMDICYPSMDVPI
ncbi:MAG TPA: hypothetical protein VFJ02_09545 [Vicinamibacterales bacterium]|nr:hypothetical protein [Vicinamibacterales bacterium]